MIDVIEKVARALPAMRGLVLAAFAVFLTWLTSILIAAFVVFVMWG
jgi:hypothetical protein